ncbi:MAG TPA: DUF1905 domain-containing protein [Gammaproteobacteria bacterium]|nr:DUF1905 domain-containing protein [Gammaproteobacteria bacterium]
MTRPPAFLPAREAVQKTWRMRAKVWRYAGTSSWYFVTLPKTHARQIRACHAFRRRGWGSLPVIVTLGGTTWKTSIFPESETGSYVLPIKAEVRRREGIAAGDTIGFTLEIGRS